MLTALEVENFKGIGRPVRIELRPITLLFGPNSSGKSSLLHALHYAREILERRNVDPDRTLAGGSLLDLGGFESIVHGRDRSRSIRLRFDFKNDGRGFPNDLLYGAGEYPYVETGIHDGLEHQFEAAWVEFSVRWSEQSGAPYVATFAVGADGRLIARIESNPEGTQTRLEDIDVLHPLVVYDGRGLPKDDESAERPLPSADWHWERAATSCDTGTRSALPDWGRRLRILRPSRKEMIQRIRTNVMPRILKLRREAVAELAEQIELPEDGVPDGGEAAPATQEHEGEDPSEEEIQREAEELADGLEARWSEALQTRLSILMLGMGQLLLEEQRSMCYLGPLRALPDRNYVAPRSPREARWANGLAAWDLLFRGDRAFIGRVGEWLERLGSGYGLRLDEFREVSNESMLWHFLGSDAPVEWLDSIEEMQDSFKRLPSRRRLVLVDSQTRLDVLPMDVGVGVSQVVPVVVAALMSDEHGATPFVVIEQPELHVHPAIQVEVGDLFAARAGREGGVLLVETHSEHLMLRLLRRIEETGKAELPPGAPGLRPEQVAVVYVECKNGEVAAHPLRIDATGEFLDRWPRGFFEERAEELF